jgi:hypothetical protein
VGIELCIKNGVKRWFSTRHDKRGIKMDMNKDNSKYYLNGIEYKLIIIIYCCRLFTKVLQIYQVYKCIGMLKMLGFPE